VVKGGKTDLGAIKKDPASLLLSNVPLVPRKLDTIRLDESRVMCGEKGTWTEKGINDHRSNFYYESLVCNCATLHGKLYRRCKRKKKRSDKKSKRILAGLYRLMSGRIRAEPSSSIIPAHCQAGADI